MDEGRHDSAIKHHEEMMFMNEHRKYMNHGEQRRYWSAVRKTYEIEFKMHELFVVVKDRVERRGGK